MTLTTGTTPAVTAAATPAAGVMRLIVDAALGALSTMPTPLRAVVTGPAGSGRSTALRALRDELSATGRTVTTLSASPTGVLPSGTTLLVDDAESLDELIPQPTAPWQPEREWLSIRAMIIHLIRETAHHCGHADIIREALDGQTTMGAISEGQEWAEQWADADWAK